MFFPPPMSSDDDKNQFTTKPPAPPQAKPPADAPYDSDHALPADVPQGDELYLYVLTCLDKRSSHKEVRQQLIAFGYSSVEAETVVADVAEWRRKNPDTHVPTSTASGSGNSNMMIGGIVCLIGLAVTLGSMAASSGGGSYVVAWGAIVWGGIQFFRGLSQSNQS